MVMGWIIKSKRETKQIVVNKTNVATIQQTAGMSRLLFATVG